MAKVRRISTGVRDIDKLIEGGVPENTLTLISGACGTGKSILGSHFLIEGARNGEPGIYVALEEGPDQIIDEMEKFGWPASELIKKKKLAVIRPDLYQYDTFLTTVEDTIKKIGAKRLVLDSISVIGLYFEDPYRVRKSIYDMSRTLKDLGVTTYLITEVREGSPEISTFGVEEYVADGAIILYYFKSGNNFTRALTIRKMRGTSHSTKIYGMKITPRGISLSK